MPRKSRAVQGTGPGAAKPKKARKPRVTHKTLASSEGLETEEVSQQASKPAKEASEPIKLTVKQELFCQAYLENGGIGADAYRTAYNTDNYTDKSIHEAASKLLKHAKVASRVEQLRLDNVARHQVTRDRIIHEYAKLAFTTMDDFMRVDEDGLGRLDLSALTCSQAAAITELTCEMVRTEKDGDARLPIIKAKIKLADKRAALDSLSKLLGFVIDKTELTGKGGTPLVPVLNVMYGGTAPVTA